MDSNDSKPIDRMRRRVLAGMAGGAALLTGCGDGASPDGGNDSGTDDSPLPVLPNPEDSGIDHIVLVMMENRSFDHFLGWVPGADGVQSGLKFLDRDGAEQHTYPLAPDYQGCALGDPNHGYDGGRVQFNGGKMDGWLLTDPTMPGDIFPIGYYLEPDLPFYSGVAAEYTVCDRYFSGILASTYPNRMYMHLGQTDRLSNDFTIASLPTIWDRLREAGVSRRYYFRDLPFIALTGVNHLGISRPYAEFALDARAGLLPSVSYIDPKFLNESPDGTAEDDHPQAHIRKGQVFLNDIYDALRNSPQWERTLLVINYDEWGGFYDHVVPPIAPVSEDEAALGNDGRLGFRVPCMMIGPRAKRGFVSHRQFDPNSILNMIAWRFGLEPLGVRGQTSLNLAYALDFESAPRSDAPSFEVPDDAPLFTRCDTAAEGEATAKAMGPVAYTRWEHNDENRRLLEVAHSMGYPVP